MKIAALPDCPAFTTSGSETIRKIRLGEQDFLIIEALRKVHPILRSFPAEYVLRQSRETNGLALSPASEFD